ncbi:NfeD family protein [Humitalea sp. 24SJ18S-53]|uniref:NfeD family protein n=1 Tax=Humitalea sp. 24SJ18S-53 TaxID=3422307 RepID=UPI003D6673EC
MAAWLIWTLSGLVALGAEMLVPGAYLLWVGTAAIGTGLAEAALDPPFWASCVIFLALLAGGVTFSLKRGRPKPTHRLNTADSGLAGRIGVMLAPDNAGQRVRIGDSDWAARLPRDVPGQPPIGARVRVEAVDGTILVVRPEQGPSQAKHDVA